MKKLISFCLALIMCMSAVAASVPVSADGDEEQLLQTAASDNGIVTSEKDDLDPNFAKLKSLPAVYVHMSNGSDTAQGTDAAPFKTLERAYDALTPGGGTIVLKASHDISQTKSGGKYLSPEPQIEETGNYFRTPSDITGPVMLRGADPEIELCFSFITFNSDHYIDSLILRTNDAAPVIECGFNNVTFGENITVSLAYEARYPFLLGGYYQCGRGLGSGDAYMDSYPYKLWKQDSRPYELVSTSEDYTISVYGGTWRSIMGGSWRVRSDASLGTIDADVTLDLGGNCVVQPLVTNSAEMNYLVSVTGGSALSSNGTATLNISGGTYNCPVYVSGIAGTPAVAEGITHAPEYHTGDLFANITGGTFVSTTINGTLRKALISATQDNENDVEGDFTLTVRKEACFVGESAFYTVCDAQKVTGTKTAHITNEIYPVFTKDHFTSWDFYGNDGPVTVYVNQIRGNDENDGLTPDTAVANLGITYMMMTPYGGTVIVTADKLASSSYYYCTPECGGPVTIRGLSSEIQWQIDYFSISSDHVFDNITICSRGDTTLIECKFNNVTFTDSVRCTGGRNPFLVGGHYQYGAAVSSPYKYFNPTEKSLSVVSTDKDYTLTVNGGTWRSIKGGNWRYIGAAHVGSIDGNVTVNIGRNAVVEPYVVSSENCFVTPSGNNASNGGSFTLNVNGVALNSPVFGSARLGSVNSSLKGEYRDFKADVNINLLGAEIGAFAKGKTYEKCYVSAKQADTTSPDIDGAFIIRAKETTIPSSARVSGEGAADSHIYTDALFAASPDGFGAAGGYNGRERVVADGNGDGLLTNADITLLVRGVAGYSTPDVYDNDLDGNKRINNRDAILLIQNLSCWNVGIVHYDYIDEELIEYNGSAQNVTSVPADLPASSSVEGEGGELAEGECLNFLCNVKKSGAYDIAISADTGKDVVFSAYRNREFLGTLTKTAANGACVLRRVDLEAGACAISIRADRGDAQVSLVSVRSAADAGDVRMDFSSLPTPLASNGTWTGDGTSVKGQGYSKIIYGSESWGDYILDAELTPVTDYKNMGILFRASGMTVDGSKSDSSLTNALRGYFVGFGTNKITLGKFNYNWKALAIYDMPLTTGQTYSFRIVARGSEIKVWVDGRLVIEYNDPDPYLWGGVGLRTHNCTLKADDLHVRDITGEELRTFKNPTVLSYHDLGDPTVFYENGRYYLMTTGRLEYYESEDLVNFEYKGSCADRSALFINNYIGGASIFKHDGIYYMFYTTYVSAGSTETIVCVATSDKITGPYTQPKQTKLDEEVCGAMSAGAFAFTAPDGQTYLYWYQTISGSGNCIFGAKVSFSDGVVSIDHDSVKMLAYPTEDWEKKQENGISGRVCERPNVYYHNGYYYLFYAGSHWMTSYGEGYAVSTSPLGDFVKYADNPILSSTDELYGVGCTYIVPSPDGSETWVVYHALNSKDDPTPRKVCIDRLIFRDNGNGADIAAILGPTSGEQLYPQ